MKIPDEVREEWKRDFEEYSKYWPWYAKVFKRHSSRRITCFFNLHIPLRDNNATEAWCQECFKELTLSDWNKFWKGHP